MTTSWISSLSPWLRIFHSSATQATLKEIELLEFTRHTEEEKPANSSGEKSFSDLPTEICVTLLLSGNMQSFLTLSQLNRSWRALCGDPKIMKLVKDRLLPEYCSGSYPRAFSLYRIASAVEGVRESKEPLDRFEVYLYHGCDVLAWKEFQKMEDNQQKLACKKILRKPFSKEYFLEEQLPLSAVATSFCAKPKDPLFKVMNPLSSWEIDGKDSSFRALLCHNEHLDFISWTIKDYLKISPAKMRCRPKLLEESLQLSPNRNLYKVFFDLNILYIDEIGPAPVDLLSTLINNGDWKEAANLVLETYQSNNLTPQQQNKTTKVVLVRRLGFILAFPLEEEGKNMTDEFCIGIPSILALGSFPKNKQKTSKNDLKKLLRLPQSKDCTLTPIQIAALGNKDEHFVRWLVEDVYKDVDLCSLTPSPLTLSICLNSNPEVVKVFLENGADPLQESKNGYGTFRNAFHLAIGFGNFEVNEFLLEWGIKKGLISEEEYPKLISDTQLLLDEDCEKLTRLYVDKNPEALKKATDCISNATGTLICMKLGGKGFEADDLGGYSSHSKGMKYLLNKGAPYPSKVGWGLVTPFLAPYKEWKKEQENQEEEEIFDFEL